MIRFENVVKSYGSFNAISNLSFTMESGQITVLIGESGCGKTTTLKMINRLITQTSGEIYINDVDIRKMDVIELRRNMGYVIQQTGLFPHMSVRENVTLIAKIKKLEEKDIERRARELMRTVELNPDEYLDRYPSELSGGQQQRVGFVRALLTDPEIILMDEPFSALDPVTRVGLQGELLKIQSLLHKTIVFVTHDMDEALRLADKICIMDRGSIIQYDTPEKILRNFKNDFVRDFVGKKRIWSFPEFIHARDIMVPPERVCGTEEPAGKVRTWMEKKQAGTLAVVGEDNLFEGTVDYLTVQTANGDAPIREIAATDGRFIPPTAGLPEILELFDRENRHSDFTLPVVEDGKLCGIITERSLVQTLRGCVESE